MARFTAHDHEFGDTASLRTVHGCRHYTSGELIPLDTEDKIRHLDSVRRQQNSSRSNKRNARRRRSNTKQRDDMSTVIAASSMVNEPIEKVRNAMDDFPGSGDTCSNILPVANVSTVV